MIELSQLQELRNEVAELLQKLGDYHADGIDQLLRRTAPQLRARLLNPTGATAERVAQWGAGLLMEGDGEALVVLLGVLEHDERRVAQVDALLRAVLAVRPLLVQAEMWSPDKLVDIRAALARAARASDPRGRAWARASVAGAGAVPLLDRLIVTLARLGWNDDKTARDQLLADLSTLTGGDQVKLAQDPDSALAAAALQMAVQPPPVLWVELLEREDEQELTFDVRQAWIVGLGAPYNLRPKEKNSRVPLRRLHERIQDWLGRAQLSPDLPRVPLLQELVLLVVAERSRLLCNFELLGEDGQPLCNELLGVALWPMRRGIPITASELDEPVRCWKTPGSNAWLHLETGAPTRHENREQNPIRAVFAPHALREHQDDVNGCACLVQLHTRHPLTVLLPPGDVETIRQTLFPNGAELGIRQLFKRLNVPIGWGGGPHHHIIWTDRRCLPRPAATPRSQT